MGLYKLYTAASQGRNKNRPYFNAIISKKRKPKPYKRADYIGQKIQIDVKFVPSYCVVNGKTIREIQTDNGSEFTNTLLVVKAKHKTLFEEALEKPGIKYHRIRVATPRHNGKAERQNRQDEERFYRYMKM